MTCFATVLVLAVTSLAAAPASTPDAPVTPDDVRAAYEKGDYQETLRVVARVLSFKGKAADGIDRVAMLMLRAEAHLKLKATSNALTALDEAAKAAKTAKDAKSVADAHALSMLIKRCKNLLYTPKVAAAAPPGEGGAKKAAGAFDITDEKQRKAALESLYAEEKIAAKAKVKAADKAKTLPPIATALKVVLPLRELELAAKGNDAETGATIKNLTDDAHTLMAKALDDITKKTDRISAKADQYVQQTITRRDGSSETRNRRQGLSNEDRNELKGMVTTCKLVLDSTKELATMFPDDADLFDDLNEQAKTTGERVHDVLTDDYSSVR